MPLLSFVGSGSRFVPVVVPEVAVTGLYQISMAPESREIIVYYEDRTILMPGLNKTIEVKE